MCWPSALHAAFPARVFDQGAIDSYVVEMMRADAVPGVALAIVQGDKIVYLRGYGDDGRGAAIEATTGFILGSMSKSFTALAIMQLVERSLVQLDAPAQTYLPEFHVADTAASQRITVRHLLNHTSGIPRNAPQAPQGAASLDDHVRALTGVELENVPGAVHDYASPNYQVLGAIVERVSGQRFGEYLAEHIFAPLQMQYSGTDPALMAHISRGHRYWFGLPIAADLPYEADRIPTAAVISNAQDLANYLIMHLNAGRFGTSSVLSSAAMAELLRPAAPGDGFEYAMGWRVGPIQGVPAIHHGGILPHFRGKMVLLPEQGYGVAVLTNASTNTPLPIAPTSHRMADAIAASLAGQALAPGTYSQGLLYLGVSLGMALVLLNQLGGLLRLRRWQPRKRAWLDVGLELLFPLLVLLLVPLLVGLPWPELARGAPDMVLWLAISAVLGLITGFAKVYLLRRRVA
jgi:CubicO group peptidase (beta-lactamase class C family)